MKRFIGRVILVEVIILGTLSAVGFLAAMAENML